MHSNHFEQISQIQNFNALNIKRETDSEVKMIAIDQSRKRGTRTGDGTLLSVKMRAIHRVNSTMRSPQRLLHFPTNAAIAILFVIHYPHLSDYIALLCICFTVRPICSNLCFTPQKKLKRLMQIGYPAYSHHDKFPPWWVFVRDDYGGNLSGDKIPP